MFLLNSAGIKNVVIVNEEFADLLSENGFPILSIDECGRYIFKGTKKVLSFLKENNISFERGDWKVG